MSEHAEAHFTYADIAKMIDHSLLNPVMTDEDLEEGCRIAAEYDVATVCIKPYYLSRCVELLADTDVKPTITVGFPHGGHTTSMKAAEAEAGVRDGARELDMVANIGKVLSRDWDFVRADIAAVVQVAHDGGALLKVIFENCYLEDEHKVRLCEICGLVSADFVKTSTGYGSGGATDHDLKLMREHAPDHVQVKAAGGVRSLDRLLEVRALGVTRVGASRTVGIMDEVKQRLGL
jgi:deoxyribose-phosphate aldolase